MAVVLSIFMFFGIPFPVYALEQLTETQNIEVVTSISQELDKTEDITDESVNEEVVTITEDVEVLSPEVKQENESSRTETDIEAEEKTDESQQEELVEPIENAIEIPVNEIPTEGNTGVNYSSVGNLNPPVSGPILQSKFRSMGLAAPMAEEDDSVVLHKTAVYQNDQTVKITLEAFATGKVATVIKEIPADIIMVLDQSGSMRDLLDKNIYVLRNYKNSQAYNNRSKGLYTLISGEYVPVDVSRTGKNKNYTYSYTYTYNAVQTTISSGGLNDAAKIAPLPLYQLVSADISKLQALKNEVQTFIDSVYEKSLGNDNLPNTADDIEHRISILGFASGTSSTQNYNNTEILSTTSTSAINYRTKTDTDLKNSLLDAVDYKTQLNRAVGWLDAEGATRSDLGMEMAKTVLLQNPIPAGEERQRIVILFTDGTPTSSSTFDSTVANAAIGYSNTIKSDSIGATTYTIGVLNEANPAATDDVNKYMNYVSSNYPNAVNLTNSGVGSYTSGYYLSATNSVALGTIFSQISSQVGGANNNNLTSETTVTDVLALQLTLPDEFDTDDVNVQAYDYIGTGNNYNVSSSWKLSNPQPAGIEVYIDSDTGAIDVSGFDYSKNYVANDAVNDKPTGKKLVITFTAAVNEDFIGGNIVSTNRVNSGIYAPDGTFVKSFIIPEVDIPIRFDANSVNLGIYLSQSIYANELISGNGLNYKINGNDYKIDGINNAYSDIKYVLYDTDGITELRSFTIKAGETEISDDSNANILLDETRAFKFAMYVIPAKDGAVPQKITELNSTVFVWNPSIEATDTTLWWGETTDLNTRFELVGWVNHEAGAVSPVLTNVEPILDLEPILVEGQAFSSDTLYEPEFDSTFNVKLKIGEVDYTDHMILQKAVSAVNQSFDFTVFVKKASLTIMKDLKDSSVMDANQSFIFNVSGPTGNYQIAMQGESSKIIEGLKLGAYTVQEVTGWSWRYDASTISVDPVVAGATEEIANGKKVVLSAANNEVTITFINEKTNAKWLNGESFAINLFGQANQPAAILNSKEEEDEL